MIVNVVDTGTVRQPDLPEGTSYSVLADYGDTMDVRVHTDPSERIAALEAQVEAATALAEDASATAQEVAQAMRDAKPKPTG